MVLARGPGSPEILVVRRAERLRAFGGFIAFPGGKVAPADADQATVQPRCVTAARELFEEAGILIARRPDRSFPTAGPELEGLRRELLGSKRSFREVLDVLKVSIDQSDFNPVGTLTTPAFSAVRFETAFFFADMPPGQTAEVWPGELDEGRWAPADILLDEWIAGLSLISPPTVLILQAICGLPASQIAERLACHWKSILAEEVPPIWYAPGVQLLPLRTMALPPSTHTNAYIIGQAPIYLVDPGPTDEKERARLFAAIDRLPRADLAAVVLSHHHPDHIGAAVATAARYELPIWAHPWTARKLAGKLQVTRELTEGDRIDLGTAPDGHTPWFLDVLHTPGHAPGHLAFYDPHYRLMFAGDLISTVSSIVIGPPEGDLTVYLASLRRLLTYPSRLLLPSHGTASATPTRTVEEAIAHRERREDELVAALQAGPRTLADLGPELYRGLPAKLMRFAELQLLAGLQKLEREGRVETMGPAEDQRWRLREMAR